MAKIDIHNFKITKQIYRSTVTLTNELQRNNFTVSVRDVAVNLPSEKLEINDKAKITFEELFNEYADLREQNVVSFSAILIENANPLVRDAYEKLGRDEVKRLKFNTANIRRELLKRTNDINDHKVAMEISRCFKPHISIPKSTIKERLQAIFDGLGVARKAKASDLNR